MKLLCVSASAPRLYIHGDFPRQSSLSSATSDSSNIYIYRYTHKSSRRSRPIRSSKTHRPPAAPGRIVYMYIKPSRISILIADAFIYMAPSSPLAAFFSLHQPLPSRETLMQRARCERRRANGRVFIHKRKREREKREERSCKVEGEEYQRWAWVRANDVRNSHTNEGGLPSRIVQSAVVQVTSDSDCADAYSRRIFRGSMFCADGQTATVCLGDSGGPAIVDDKLAAVISGDWKCIPSWHPTLLTKISIFFQWIKDITRLPL